MAKSKIVIDNSRTRVTEWKFEPGKKQANIFMNTIMLLSQWQMGF